MTDDILRHSAAANYVFVPMWPPGLGAQAGGMHPYHHIALAHHHIADMQATAERHRFARRARRQGGARSPAPGVPDDGATILPFVTAPNWRRPAA